MGSQDTFVTANSILLAVNTVLVLIAGFLLRDAWKNIHARISAVEREQREGAERLAIIESTLFRHPLRRREDAGDYFGGRASGPQPQGGYMRSFLLFSLLAFLSIIGGATMLFAAQDPTVPVGPVSEIGTVLVGLASAALTGLVTKGASKADQALGNVDNTIRKGIGPTLPFVTTGLAVLLPILGKAIGVTDLPPADVFAQAPASAIIGIAAREALRKWIFKRGA